MIRGFVVLFAAAACGRSGFDAALDATHDAPSVDAGSRYAASVLADSPTAYWRLDETSGTVAEDSANSHSHFGNYVNMPVLASPGALVGDSDTAVSFSGAQDQLVINDAPELRLNGSWSIELWIKLVGDSGASFPAMFAKGDSTNGTGWLIYYHPNGTSEPYAPVFKRANIDELHATPPIVTSQFHYYALTYDGTTLRWYVDAVPDLTYVVTWPTCDDTSPLVFASQLGVNYADVVLDEIAIYATALPFDRVMAHYAAAQ